MLEALAQSREFTIGDNQPYPIEDDIDYTIPVHGEARRMASVMIEIRQDGIRTAAGAAGWATRVAEAYRVIEAAALRFFGCSFSANSVERRGPFHQATGCGQSYPTARSGESIGRIVLRGDPCAGGASCGEIIRMTACDAGGSWKRGCGRRPTRST